MARAGTPGGTAEPRKDFFISYTQADAAWAEWIAAELEQAGYSTVLQAWDFRPGANFVSEMHRALRIADRTIPVFSPSYFQSRYGEMEWTAALRVDALIPVRVRDCQPEGLLGPIVYIDLVG